MSVNDYVDSVQGIAREALGTAKAIEVCSRHPEVTIRVGDDDAERHAYAIATNILKRDDGMDMREDVLEAIKDELVMAAEGECPECAHQLRDDD